MRLVIAFSSLLAVVVTHPSLISDEDQWQMFKVNFNRKYDSFEEEEYRKEVFIRNLEKIRNHNAKYEQGESTYRMGVNKFADVSHEEFSTTYANLKVDLAPRSNPVFEAKGQDTPQEVDWRKKGAVTEVKDQGHCGSCWAFSATGSIEGQHFLATKQLVSLSEQNLVDCASNDGCGGSFMDSAFEYVIQNKGIDTESGYPYKAKDGQCQFNNSNVGASISSFVDVSSGDEAALQEAVATVGPVSVAIDANSNFQLYAGGVYNDATCFSTKEHLDHGVLVVGYGHDEQAGDFWIVKNSWGAQWGEQGYVRMSRNKENQCGIATLASYPKV